MSGSRRALVLIFGLALLIGLTLAVPVLAWYFPDAGIPVAQDLPDLAPPAPNRGEVHMLAGVFTQLEGCDKTDAQNVNAYYYGDWVSAKSSGFTPYAWVNWSISPVPDTGAIASGTVQADASGNVCADHVYQIGFYDDGVYKFTLGNKTDNYSVDQPGMPRLELTKIGTESVCVSDLAQTVYYTYTITNNGAVDLYNVDVDDTLTGKVANDVDFDAGASATYYATDTIPAGEPAGSWDNSATAAGNTRDTNDGEPVSSAQATWTVNIENCCAIEVTIAPASVELNCKNSHSAQLTATPTEATGAVTYQWYKVGTGALSGETGSTLNVTTAGEYYVVATDTGVPNCSDESNHSVVTSVTDPVVTINADATELNCNNADALLTASVNGGETPLAYQWYKDGAMIAGATNSTYTATAAGTYYVHVTDNNQCADDSNEIVVTSVPNPVATISADATELNCNNADALLTASVNGGETPLAYQWYKDGAMIAGATNSTYLATAAGTYYVHVTDNNQCADDSNEIVVTSVPNPVATISADDAELNCNNADALLTASVTPGEAPYTYAWYKNGALIAGAANATYTATGAGTYYVHVTDHNQCTDDSNEIVVSSVPNPVVTISADDAELNCNNADALLTASVTPGEAPYAYQWYKNGAIIAGATNSTYTATGAGTYYVHVADNNQCADDSNEIVVTSVPNPVVTISTQYDHCAGKVTFTASPSSGETPYTLAWDIDGDGFDDGTGPTKEVSGYGLSGTVAVRVTDGNQCQATDTKTYAINPKFEVTITADDAELNCKNLDTLLTAHVTGGEGPFEYRWYKDGVKQFPAESTYLVTAAGTYSVHAWDKNSCSDDSNEVVVSSVPDPAVSISSTVYDHCAGKVTFTASASSGETPYTFAWDVDGDGFDDGTGTTQEITGYGKSGTVRVQVTDHNGCTAIADQTFAINAQLTVEAKLDSLQQCTGYGCLSALASGGNGAYTYAWDLDNDGEFDDGTGTTACHLFADGKVTVRVRVTDGNRCMSTDDIEIVVAVPAPKVEITKTVCKETVYEGTVVTYKYYITNTGTCPLLNVTLADDKIPGVSAALLGGLTDQDGDGAKDDLAVGAAASAMVNQKLMATTHNCATVTGRNARGATASAGDCADVTVIHPCISLVKTGPAAAHEGDIIHYTFTVKNCSKDATLYGVTVYDAMFGTWGPRDLQPGEEVSQTLPYTVPAPSGDPLCNYAVARGKDVLGGQWTDDDEHCVDILHPCIDIAKEGVYQAHEGDTITYNFRLANCSTDTPLVNVTVTDPLLGGVIWGPHTLGVGEVVLFSKDYVVPTGAPDPVENTVTATGKDELGKVVSDKSYHFVDILHPCIDLEKTGPAVAYEGELITYEFTLTNCSADTDLHDVTVTDPLLGGVIWGPGYLEAQQSVSFTRQHQVPWAPPEFLVNEALAEGYDPLDLYVSDPAEVSTRILAPLGFKFSDKNWDGVKQPTEPFIGMWQIRIVSVETGQEWTVWTNNSPLSGHYGYWFPPKDMPAGRYDVYEVGKAAWTQTHPNTNGGKYRIYYHGDGHFDLLSIPPQPYYGLSFGNAPALTPCPCPDWVVFHSNRDGNWELYGVSAYGGTPVRLTNDLAVDTAPAISHASAEADRRVAFQSNRNGKWDIYRVDTDGQNTLQLTAGAGNNTDPVWAPLCDAQKLAFVSDRGGSEDIFVMNGDGTGQQRLTNSSTADTDPDWAPTADAIVFQSMRNGNWDIYRIDVFGTNLIQLTNANADDVDPVWSPDGKWIAFRSNRTGSWQTYFMPATGGTAVQLSASGINLQAVWSPDSTRLAYQSVRDGNWEIYVGDITTLAEIQVTHDAAKSQAPTWSCSGDSLVYQTDADGNWELYHVDIATGLVLAHVTNNPATDVYPAWVPGEEDGSLEGLDIPQPTPMPTATPLPTATPTATRQPTQTPVATETPIPTFTPVQTSTPIATATAVPTEPAAGHTIYLSIVKRGHNGPLSPP